ncbi:hypothetical protein FE784_21930 [Paenibacillus hemerocallicola]|jgi:hypothetical protein|uniref:Uncharacterized protein n=1 Tax=Paenibacillus hemerocallicola TaxID=1172614 RepID=A0A5C4T773_9BACL|nr:hypothetical protein [Paenibacillus hemerocallicola]TNJ64129.1 hypothetical protein FE784_21930 [Paenibacillus hemerocallicola]
MSIVKYSGLQDLGAVVAFFMENDEHLIGNPVFADIANVDILNHSLFKMLDQVKQEKDFHDLLNYKNLLYNQLVHYCDSIESIEGLKDDFHEIVVHRIYTGTEIKILSWIYKDLYGDEPDLSNPEANSPQGFLRYLKLNCKPEVTAHFIGLALQQYVSSQYPEEEFYKNESIFSGSYNYLAEFVLETEEIEQVVKTIQGQQEELVWLRDQLIASEEKLQITPDDEETQQQQQKLIVDFMTERLEMEFLSQVIIRLF